MPKLPKVVISLVLLPIVGYGYWIYQSDPGQAEWLFITIYILLWLPMVYVALASYLIWPSLKIEQHGVIQAQILAASLTFGGAVAVLPLLLFDQSILIGGLSAGLGSLVTIGSYAGLRSRATRFAGNIEEG